jgi:hypothetical protein
MKHLVWLWLLCSLVGCSSTPPRANGKAVFGDKRADAVTVTVGEGFQFPGTYHLPAGTRLGLLLDFARVLPSAMDWHHIVGRTPVPCQVRSSKKQYRAVAQLGDMKKKDFRELVLNDGDEVAFIRWNF